MLINNSILLYGISDAILTDNGVQFVAKSFKIVCHVTGIKLRTATAHHPKTNGQAVRYIKTIVARLRQCVGQQRDDGDRYFKPLTYCYKLQSHRLKRTAPFNLVKLSNSSIIKRSTAMFDKMDNLSVLLQASYK